MRYSKTTSPGAERALTSCPPLPKSLKPAERAAAEEIIAAGIARGVLAPGDLPLVLLAARAKARADALLSDPKAKVTATNASVRLAADLLTRLRLAPTSSGHEPRPPSTSGRAPMREFFTGSTARGRPMEVPADRPEAEFGAHDDE